MLIVLVIMMQTIRHGVLRRKFSPLLSDMDLKFYAVEPTACASSACDIVHYVRIPTIISQVVFFTANISSFHYHPFNTQSCLLYS